MTVPNTWGKSKHDSALGLHTHNVQFQQRDVGGGGRPSFQEGNLFSQRTKHLFFFFFFKELKWQGQETFSRIKRPLKG